MRKLIWISVVGMTLAGVVPAEAAYESEVTVSAFDTPGFDLFSPSTIELRRGGTVTFVFDGPSTHTATDGSGLDLYDSEIVHAGGPDEAFTYVAAGTYDVVCTLHEQMGATVYVPASVSPSSATRGDTLVVRWASAPAPGGYAYDVRLRKPGGEWKPWRSGVTSRSGTIEATRTGTWRFRARIASTSTSAMSDWSRVSSASVV